MNRKLDPLNARVNKLTTDVGRTCQPGAKKVACVPPEQLPGAEDTAATLAAQAPGSDLTIQAAEDESGSDLVGLTQGDGIAFGTFDRRSRVERLQEKLNEKGASLSPDGMFGAQTTAALNQLQERIGVPAQDTVDPASADALEAGEGTGAEISRLEGLKLQDGITFGTWQLRPRVSELQGRLTGHGFACAVDGMFGNETLAALNGFQDSRGLPAGTVVDRDTADALEDREAAPQCPAGQVPIPEAALG